MPDDTDTEGGWSGHTLKTYFDMRLAAADERYAERYQASQGAVEAALFRTKEAHTP